MVVKGTTLVGGGMTLQAVFASTSCSVGLGPESRLG